MKKDLVLMDGAVGTSLWEKTDDRGPVWRYNLKNPQIVHELHREFIDAGAQIILANTFGANGPAVKRSSDFSTEEVVRTGVAIAKEEAKGTGVKVALAAGPLFTLMEPYGDTTEEEAFAIYDEMFRAGMKEHPDLIYLQTFIDLTMIKTALKAAKQFDVPVLCSMSFEKIGKTIMGNSVEDMVSELTPLEPDALGLNCSIGPDLALPVVKEFTRVTDLPIVFKPNAGKPILQADGTTQTSYDPQVFVDDVLPAADFVTYLGGCCGCNASYISLLNQRLHQKE